MTGQAPIQAGSGVSILEPNQTINDITQKLSGYLTATHSPPFTAPVGFDDALNDLGSPDPIAQVFQSRGFWSWLAYFLATKDPKTQPPLSLSGIPYDTLSVIACHVSEVPVEKTLLKRIQITLWVARRGASRRCEAGISGFPSCPSTMPMPSPEPNPRKRPRGQFLEDPDDPAHVAQRPRSNNTISGTPRTDTTNSVYHPAAGQPTEELHTFDHLSQPMLNVDPPDGYAYPDARRIPSVFRPELGDMIARNGHKASIFASFPPDAAKCRLLLNIEAAEVSPLVMRLYGIQIVEIEQQRAFSLPGGVNAAISGSVQFTKTKLSLLDELFGDLIIQGVRNSRRYLDEVAQGIMLSKCVRMEVPGAADCPAQITVTINEFALNNIITKLWLS
ncbi:uncharacterized protein BKA55DRAFT_529765 [Fusarium redolens]|uniref:Uncharacterized protein n=1 Tax=Fusarium redolens TaxID=48865 RepID=A0A9P9FWE0_FUSRE|nr:uncharacterized protein BKA55DRAFT_529765 [Fusarium redolens]KAH7208442.1 hypothetical protein BKA55DRAFT_529765 [Fusarium redolens]